MAKNSEIKNHIEVGGVVLTQQAINRLNCLQEHNNENINSIRNNIADAICYIVQSMDGTSYDQQMQFLIADLSCIRDYFLDFQKP